jgi:hypothetical protein
VLVSVSVCVGDWFFCIIHRCSPFCFSFEKNRREQIKKKGGNIR